MDYRQTRFILIFAISIVSALLYDAWSNKDLRQVEVEKSSKTVQQIAIQENDSEISIPKEINKKNNSDIKLNTNIEETKKEEVIPENRIVKVESDLLSAKIDKLGGNIISLSLKKHFYNSTENKKENYILISEKNKKAKIEADILSQKNNKKLLYTAENNFYKTENGKLHLTLIHKNKDNVVFEKTYIFSDDSYTIDVDFKIKNEGNTNFNGRLYTLVKTKNQEKKSGGFFSMLGSSQFNDKVILGMLSEQEKYIKINLDDVKKKIQTSNVKDGWSAAIEHYFITAWITEKGENYYYQTKKFKNETFGIVAFSDLIDVKPSEVNVEKLKLFAGPEDQEMLKSLAKGLDLTVDYGIFWFICQPIFWLLKQIYLLAGNWGVAIMGTTLVVRILLYRIVASGHKSMAAMKKLQPRLDALKEKYKDDKQAFSQAMLELYKKEKVNPFSGCFMAFLQFPVFISLYYVLLNSVELRDAPFIGWITDLSMHDPYYILPVLMGLTLFVQQKLFPPVISDPAMANMMTFLPLFLTFIFLKLPAGLVLYWVFSNLLSIVQQWYITKKVLDN